MALKITNSLTKKLEEFIPLKTNEVKMYVCGPTVYNLIHIGNARPIVFFSVVRNYLKYLGYKVTYVSNFTDVDDKIIQRAREEKISAKEVSEKYIQEFKKDVKALNIFEPDHTPTVTGFMEQIIRFIKGLIDKGFAYVNSEGEVLFEVRKFKPYGKLSGKNIDELVAGHRVAIAENKKDPLDFALWKPKKSDDEPAWNSPWGLGRPGWHIECSAMSMHYLGESFDIHGGGQDLIHPHHENEIAQSEALSGKNFVRYWMHNNMLSMQDQKMSKSLGNIFLLRDFMNMYGAESLKFLLLSGHYRSLIDFSEKQIINAQHGLHRIYSTLLRSKSFVSTETQSESLFPDFEEKWKEAMDDDFNTPKVFALVFDYVKHVNQFLDSKSRTGNMQIFLNDIKKLSGVLSVFGEEPESFLKQLKSQFIKDKITQDEILILLQKRQQFRQNKKFKEADEIRYKLMQLGIAIKDTPSGSDWDIEFPK